MKPNHSIERTSLGRPSRTAPKTAGFAQLSPPYGATGAARSRRLLRVRAEITSAHNQDRRAQ